MTPNPSTGRWGRVEFKGRTERWCYAEERDAFGVPMIYCEQPFQKRETKQEYYNADIIFKFTVHPKERVLRELDKLEARWDEKTDPAQTRSEEEE